MRFLVGVVGLGCRKMRIYYMFCFRFCVLHFDCILRFCVLHFEAFWLPAFGVPALCTSFDVFLTKVPSRCVDAFAFDVCVLCILRFVRFAFCFLRFLRSRFAFRAFCVLIVFCVLPSYW